MPELTVFQNDRKVFSLPLDARRLSIGRSATNDLILTGDEVSRTHAVIEWRDSGFWLSDVSSLGTRVDGKKITKPVLLTEGARITIADWSLIFSKDSRFQDGEEDRRRSQITRLTQKKGADDTQILEFKPGGRVKRLRATLEIQEPDSGPRHFLVNKTRIVVGTSREADIVLSDPFVSKCHCEFRLSDRGFCVRDLDSTNGTLINGVKLKEAYIRADEVVGLGRSKITVHFEREGEAELMPFEDDQFCGIYGRSFDMRLLFRKIQQVAATDMTVLIQGESGVGKEMVARAVHDLSGRRQAPYVVLNCGAISPNLIESELFGHEKGAFTGAERQHKGAFEQANGGTLFLDEIGELPPALQSKILRILEYQRVRRVGGREEIAVNVRLVAATHRDLARMVSQGQFREDLFYRLYVLPLRVPPLRERRQDIPLLAGHFLKKFAPERGLELAPETVDKLSEFVWPGNVRELKNTILRAIVFCEGRVVKPDHIELIHVPREPKSPVKAGKAVTGNPLVLDKEQLRERERILMALEETGGDKSKAAKILGIGRSTLFRRIKEYGLNV